MGVASGDLLQDPEPLKFSCPESIDRCTEQYNGRHASRVIMVFSYTNFGLGGN